MGLAHARFLSPANAARSIALMTASFGLGQMIGPVAAGILFDRAGNPADASMLAATALVLAAALAAGSHLLRRNA
jgi:predicted MFS family arabinose efflux permease